MAEPVEPPPVEAPFSFPPRRRSHLMSQTYLNLVKILSIRHGNSPLASAPPIIPLDLIQEKGNNQERQATAKEMEPQSVVCLNDKQPSKVVVPDSGQLENLSSPKDMAVHENLQDTSVLGRQLSSTQITINDIEKMMQMEEDRGDLNQNDVLFCGSREQIGLQGRDFGLEDILINELENIMKGKEEPGRDDSAIPFASSLDENNYVSSVVATSMANQEDITNEQPIVKESGLESVFEGGQEDFFQKSTESTDRFSDNNLPDVSNSDGTEEGRPLPKTDDFVARCENRQKEMECEKSLGSSAIEILPGHIIEGEIEEGEISGDYGTESINWLSEDDGVSGLANLNEKQLIVGKFNELPSNSQNIANVCSSEPTSFTTSAVDSENRVREVELTRKANGATHGLGPVLALPKTLHGEILKQSSGKEAVTFQDKGAGAHDKKKLSRNERKKRKREKARDKRAIENQKPGVKRLKLQTVLTPKTTRTCQHYLVGRCYEGEKCRFSHDEVPLTKSTPCSYFARNSCMKGEGCPFDHELSKYPCTNYTSTGFCARGDSCLFSHKPLPPGESPSTSNASGSGVKASLPGDSNSKKQSNACGSKIQRVNGLSHPVAAFTQNNMKQNVAEIHALPPSHAAKPASGVSAADSLVRRKLPPKKNSTRVGSQIDECVSDTIPAGNGSPKITPSTAPRGINFLSFGKATLRDSQTGDRAGALSKERELNRMVEKTQPANSPTGVNFFSPAKALTGFRENHSEVSSPSTSQRDKDQSSQENPHAPIRHSNLNTVYLNQRASPLAPGQSSKLLEHKNSPNSVSKVLMSTLDFAAKFDSSKNKSVKQRQPASDQRQQAHDSTPNSAYKTFMPPLACAAMLDSELKTNRPTGNPFSVRANGQKGDASITGCSGSKSADTSSFMEFLSSFSSKRKQ